MTTPIPTKWVGNIAISGNVVNEEISVPLATYETPLFPSVNRGARVSRMCTDGVRVTVIDARMTRSIIFETDNAAVAFSVAQTLNFVALQSVANTTSRFAELLKINSQIVGNLLFLRLEFATGDASGHNMVTKAAEAVMQYLLNEYPQLGYGSISGNFCSDKKVSAVNSILGRGKYCVAEILIPADICEKQLRTTATKVCNLNTYKNHIGSNIAGSLCSANAHFANMLLAFYLATGQDAANIVEGSQGIVHTENRNGALYFSCTLPNLIVGTVGNGKGLDFVSERLEKLGCCKHRPKGENAKRLAAICAATVLCGELSLLAAQTNISELMRSHLVLERNDHQSPKN